MNEQEAIKQAEGALKMLENKASKLEKRALQELLQVMSPAQRRQALKNTGIAICRMAAEGESFKIQVKQDQ